MNNNQNDLNFNIFLNNLIEKQNILLIKEICKIYKKDEKKMLIEYYKGDFK